MDGGGLVGGLVGVGERLVVGWVGREEMLYGCHILQVHPGYKLAIGICLLLLLFPALLLRLLLLQVYSCSCSYSCSRFTPAPASIPAPGPAPGPTPAPALYWSATEAGVAKVVSKVSRQCYQD